MLSLFYNFPFIPGNRISKIDTYTAGVSQTNYKLLNNNSNTVGAKVQIDANLALASLKGFTFPDSSHINLTATPATGAQIVVPGQLGLIFTEFDAVTIPGVASPANVAITKFYLADDTTGAGNILNNTYRKVTGNPGIAVFFSNYATAAGAQLFWSQLACADANGGNTLAFLATGTTLYVHDFYASTSLLGSAASSLTSTTISVNSASGFYPGDYIILNPGGTNQENPTITAIDYANNIFTVPGLNFAHNSGELVIMNGLALYAKMTIPIGYLVGVAQTFINLCPTIDCLQVAR